ncbi:MAG: transglutaminase domain-containing protein [Pedobacter sp.]|nr:transglutaminase domain-containing protein [Pedobacter sp.]
MFRYLTLLSLLFSSFIANAQNFSYGQIDANDFNYDKRKIDSNANAVVLKEYGTARLQLDEGLGQLVILFDYHVKLKIYNKEGFSEANIVIPTHKSGDKVELIQDLKATTYTMENGIIKATEMDKKALFNENKSKYLSLTKFTLPNIKEGSVIEYSYHMQSPFIFNFKTWEFQGDIPKVSSDFVAFIPANYNYNVILRGFNKLSDQKSEIDRECLRLSGVAIDCSKMTYTMNNVPAFIAEDFMTAPSNFKSAIYFELSDVQLLNGSKQAYTKTWKDVDYELVSEKNFGGQMKRKDIFKDLMPTILQQATTDLEKAQAIYNYLKKQLKWDHYYAIYSKENMKTILESRSGDIADLNLTLVAALSAANLDAEAVLLSTRENGLVNKIYPVITDFDYVIAKVNIGEKSYLLDITDPLLPFGLLPLRCINDQGRVINLKKPSYWIDLKASQKSVTKYLLSGKLNSNGKITGTLSTTTLGYAALNRRKDIKNHNSIAEYVEKLDEQLPKISIQKQQILNVDSVEQPLIEIYEIEFEADHNNASSQLFLNPFLINRISKNPFNLNERTYPVDLGSSVDERISINIALPGSYTLQEKPKDMAIALPQNGGRYLLQTAISDHVLSLNQILQLNNAIYSADDYLYLKEFYSKIIQNQKTDALLTKNN